MFSVVYWPYSEFIHISCVTITIHNLVREVREEATVFQGAGGGGEPLLLNSLRQILQHTFRYFIKIDE